MRITIIFEIDLNHDRFGPSAYFCKPGIQIFK
jgi:hypothetical protein